MSLTGLPGERARASSNDLLNGEGVLLALPAVVAGAVVFQKQADIAARHQEKFFMLPPLGVELRRGRNRLIIIRKIPVMYCPPGFHLTLRE